ncbi:MAG: hypothetical protein E6J90_00765 [Deltaproteobacteria bacterium]|nr:MAG: hypothetical protein E6J90_00765 [Deltaproteobacteria bacterium]
MLARPHLSIRGRRPERMLKPDPDLLVDVVASRVLDAWHVASEALARAGVRHVVIGGLAVAASGYPRATKVVDFLVGDEAFNRHAGGLVTMNPAIPIEVNGVAIDYLSPHPGEDHLGAALAAPPGSFIDVARLIYLKLKASRLQDRADVASLVKSGIDVDVCRDYLVEHAPGLVAALDKLVAQAAAEE